MLPKPMGAGREPWGAQGGDAGPEARRSDDVPIFSVDGRVLGVVEVCKTPERLLATIRRGRIAIWSISFAGALLLYLVTHPLLTLVYRKEVEEETLRAETSRLEAEVAKRTEQRPSPPTNPLQRSSRRVRIVA